MERRTPFSEEGLGRRQDHGRAEGTAKQRQYKLSEFCEFAAGGKLRLTKSDYQDQGFPAFSAAGQDGLVSIAEYDVPAIVVSAIGARCGKAFLATGRWTTLANTYVVIPDIDLVEPRFLWYQLNDESSWIRSGSAQAFLRPSDIQQRRVDLPALAEQRRVVGILDQVERLCTLRAEADAKAERLLPALFLSMFGDPSTNPMRWTRRSFSEVFEDITSKCPKVPRRDYRPEGRFPIVDQGRGTMVAGYSDDLDSCYRGPSAAIVFGDHTRAVKYVEPPFVAGADGSRVLRARGAFEPSFLATQLLLQPIPDRGYSRHMRLLKRLSFIAPDFRLQQRFADVSRSVRALMGEQRRARCRLQDLAKSLHARAFSGMLAADSGEEGPERTGFPGPLAAGSQHPHGRN